MMKSKKSRKKWLLSLMAVMGIFLAGVYAVACGGEKQAEKLRDLEFAVIGPDETPQELAQIIEEKKNDSFRLTYTSGNDLYIAAGYGKQETGGYSITVPELYLTDNSIIVKTELKGPERSEPTGEEPSYPYIVLRTELLEEPVVFQWFPMKQKNRNRREYHPVPVFMQFLQNDFRRISYMSIRLVS